MRAKAGASRQGHSSGPVGEQRRLLRELMSRPAVPGPSSFPSRHSSQSLVTQHPAPHGLAQGTLQACPVSAWRCYLLQAVSLWSSGTSWIAWKHGLWLDFLFSSSDFGYVIFVKLQGGQILTSSL